jgi:hypothetical protein
MTKLVTGVLSTVIALVAVSQTQAAFLPLYSGNSQFLYGPGAVLTQNPGADGAVNFSVFDNTGDPDWTNNFGAAFDAAVTYSFGGGAAADSAKYVYFYQLVNTDPAHTAINPPVGGTHDPLKGFQVQLTGGTASITGAGWVTNRVFTDPASGGAATGPGANARLGFAPNVTPGDDIPGTGVPSEFGTTPSGFATITAAIEPAFTSPLSQAITFNFLPFFGSSTIPLGGYSSILFITTNAPPVYLRGSVQDFSSTEADIPSPFSPTVTPEPGTFVSLGGALVCGAVALMAYGKRKLRT